MEHRLEPGDLATLLDRAVELYREHLPVLMGLSALYLPVGLLKIGAATAGFGPDTGVGLLAFMAALLLVGPLSSGAMVVAVGEAHLGRPVSMGGALRSLVPRLPALYGAYLLVMAMVLGGFMLCLVPGIILSFQTFFVLQTLLLEGLTPMAAIRRSRQLIARGGWKRVFGLGVAATAMTWFTWAGPGMLLRTLLPDAHTAAVFDTTWETVGEFLMSPLQTGAVVLLYYDFRVRLEALDLRLLLDQLPRAEGPPPPRTPESTPVGAGPGSLSVACTDCGSPLPPTARSCPACGGEPALVG